LVEILANQTLSKKMDDGLAYVENSSLIRNTNSTMEETPIYGSTSQETKQSSLKLYSWQLLTLICVAVGVTSVYCSWALLSISFDLLINDPKIRFTRERSGTTRKRKLKTRIHYFCWNWNLFSWKINVRILHRYHWWKMGNAFHSINDCCWMCWFWIFL
jgi:hypothetical protein